MTVSSIVPVNNYTGNSSSTTFDFDFLIEDESELEVQYTDSDGVTAMLTLGVDYSVNEIGNENGSYITFPLDTSSYDILGEDEKISLMLTLPIQQESEFENSTYFNFTVLEWTFDYIVRILQILSRQIERCVKVNEGADTTADELLEEINEFVQTALNAAQSASSSETISAQCSEEMNTLLAEFYSAYNEYYQNILDTGIETRSKIDLSNLSDSGEKHFLNKMQITNAILENPKKIYSALSSDGVLTVKSGSIVIIPNGFDSEGNKVFEYYTLSSDLTLEAADSITDSILAAADTENNQILYAVQDYWYSGSSAPSLSVSEAYWYDTEENKVKYTTDTGESWQEGLTLPFCLLECSSGVITEIKQVFDCIGFIGSTVWIDKGLTVLIPSGINDYGMLNNTECTIGELTLNTFDLSGNLQMRAVYNSETEEIDTYTEDNIYEQTAMPQSLNETTYCGLWKNPAENKVYRADSTDDTPLWEEYPCIELAAFEISNEIIKDMEINPPFEAADKRAIIEKLETELEAKADSDLSNCTQPYVISTYSSGASWYRLYSDGFLMQGGYLSGTGSWGYSTVTLSHAFANTNYIVTASNYDTTSSDYTSSSTSSVRGITDASACVYSRSTSSFQIASNTSKLWAAFGFASV